MKTLMERDADAMDCAEESRLGFENLRDLSQSEIEEVLAADPPLDAEVARAVAGILGDFCEPFLG